MTPFSPTKTAPLLWLAPPPPPPRPPRAAGAATAAVGAASPGPPAGAAPPRPRPLPAPPAAAVFGIAPPPENCCPADPNEPAPPISGSPSGRSFGRYAASDRASYQKTLTGGILARAGNSKRVTDFFGNWKGLLPSCEITSTLVGAPSIRAMFTDPRMWHAISPSAPQPKSKKPRQLNGL